jgi:hypothetical protein
MLGKWSSVTTDANSAGQFATTETRTHNNDEDGVNELTGRQFNNGAENQTLTYDKVGNILVHAMGPDGDDPRYRYTHDAWNRLVKVEYSSAVNDWHTRGVYRYNGLHWRVSKEADLRGATANDPPDGDIDQQRLMYYTTDWRLIQEDINDDVDANNDDADRRFIYIYGIRGTDDIALRRQRTLDAQGEPTGTPTDYYHLTDPLFSTVAVVDHAAKVLERIEYTAYGLALHHPPADITGDRLVDNTDQQAIISNPSTWGVGDLNHDGIVNRADQALVLAGWASTALPMGRLSKTDNIFGLPWRAR